MSFTVTPPWAYTLQLPQDPRGPGIARRTVRTVLAAYGMQALTAVAELVTSELVTNAYLYSDAPYSLRLDATGPGRLRVSVRDGNPYIPAPFRGGTAASAEDGDERGRGLRLVELCADDFGARPLGDGGPFGEGGGKLLWAECAEPAADAGDG
ncbi:ATP-binding protein [Streptomyces somaliensis DSM 40738]|uniref:ATP-binding protein n=1 Tax=Streptomyces somaliensis (strain ATCC 33201 / DSM 40738 / JCM 12659 / KCTC 9044 / NCTC 11332 / NRRL B-12077 / IP 733) TaxID=1134445 RepID=A0AA44DAF7_STRE0|nr:ATP-binding protein [Streptomyces somaliensis]MCQ0023391.1 ATP-binding protein [Streptomyces somaliensis DSM 40738]NKY12780.1 ATP-binding protein [Streptomyces somaliensis DSM 40738]